MTHRFDGKGLYILDEPEAALSPTRQMAMLSRIHQLVEQDSQFIIATHSPIILAYPQARIHEIKNGILHTREYTQTEHYSITKSFLNHYQEMTNQLLK